MQYEKIVRKYLSDFQKVAKTVDFDKSNELATRPCVHIFVQELVNSLNKNIVVHHDRSFTKTEKPDWRLEDSENFGIYCFGDHKKTNFKDSPKLSDSEVLQIKRYLALGRPVFVFDGLEFIFYDKEFTNNKKIRLIEKPVNLSSNWDKLTIYPEIEFEFRKLLENPGFRQWSESELIEQLAVRARELTEELIILLNAPALSGINPNENKLIDALHQLKDIIADHHDSSLSDDISCANFIAQVLSFGLFYAHTKNRDVDATPEQKQKLINDFWNTSKYSNFAQQLKPFKAIIDSLSEVLSEENVLKKWYSEVCNLLAHAEFMGTKNNNLDFHVLFEKFLEKFDPKMRYDRGAFYTPQCLSFWLANFTNEIAKYYFGNGIFKVSSKIIEPCMGTGSIIEELLKLNNCDENNTTLIGLEILPAPYALSHYRISELLKKELSEKKINIYLTDTLSDDFDSDLGSDENVFSEDKNDAKNICKKPIHVVIGNPPSTIVTNTHSPREKINKLLDDFRPPKEHIKNRQNIQKALNNDSLRFLRWAVEKISDSEHAIVSMILPGSFSNSISYKYARKWLLEKFDNIYVLEIDADARSNIKTDSVFNVKQGRLAIICVKSNQHDQNLFHIDITKNSLFLKQKFLESCYHHHDFEKLPIDKDNYFFCKKNDYPVDEWESFNAIFLGNSEHSIFKNKCSALKLAPSSLLFHTEKPILLRRANEIGCSKNSDKTQEVMDKWFKGQSKPPRLDKITESVKIHLKKVKMENLSPYTFRPFLDGWVINNNNVFESLENIPNSGTRSRPELRLAFDENTIGIAISPSPKDLDSELNRFASFVWNLPDNDIVARGNGMVLTAKYPNNYRKHDLRLSSNINDMYKSYLNDDDIIYYTYAILSSSYYLERYSGILYGSFNDFNPLKIPLTSVQSIKNNLVLLGKNLARCENFTDSDSCSYSHGDFTGNITNTFNLKKVTTDQGKIILTSDINESLLIENIDPRILSLKISGHNVVDKWLRERTFSYLKRAINISDIQLLQNLLGRILMQFKIIQDIDILLEKIIVDNDVI
ncbi:TPA: type ISP restriction/modification enzyme [Yersinia enterocolitica]|nr:N-6 DNA methylase [Yersinia enterocolitica]HDZ9658535.1 N-6 DNA methylase [Yersinia enterocolitica]HEM6600467.1 N-6 DNA methylase [Yersinia enterocolitica]HEN3534828.1 N-6 DNA methylase [Yersinia enterocolitica]